MNFVFDLDDTVCLAVDDKPEQVLRSLNQELGAEYMAYHTMYVLGCLHLIYPGFYALFRWLDELGGKLLFFSGGIASRNKDLIAQLIRRALPDRAEALLPTIKILSRHDRIRSDNLPEHLRGFMSICWGNTKKKLADVVVTQEELPDTVLIEDDVSYITGGEEANFIQICADSIFYFSPDFNNFKSLHKSYYLAGLFNRMLELKRTQGLSLSRAAWALQVQSTGQIFNRDFRYPTRYDRSYFDEGLAILQRYEPGLQYYCDPNAETWKRYYIQGSDAPEVLWTPPDPHPLVRTPSDTEW